jgi:hypothetical protein
MTREEFIEILKENKISYEIKGNKVVITHMDTIFLHNIDTIPSNVEFNNRGSIYLYRIKFLPQGVVFNNSGSVTLDSVRSISKGVYFNNEGVIELDFIIGGWFFEWEGNIKGIDEKRLLNKMISLGLFER